jgi:hypothetical protein
MILETIQSLKSSKQKLFEQGKILKENQPTGLKHFKLGSTVCRECGLIPV